MKGIDIIRDAYIEAITANIVEGNYANTKYLVETLERFASEINTKPVVAQPVAVETKKSVQNTLVGLFDEEDLQSGVTSADMRDYVIKYVYTHGATISSKVYDAFGRDNASKFLPHDLDIINDNAPRWRNRMYNITSTMRHDGVLMPHRSAYMYKLELTPSHRKIASKQATN